MYILELAFIQAFKLIYFYQSFGILNLISYGISRQCHSRKLCYFNFHCSLYLCKWLTTMNDSLDCMIKILPTSHLDFYLPFAKFRVSFAKPGGFTYVIFFCLLRGLCEESHIAYFAIGIFRLFRLVDRIILISSASMAFSTGRFIAFIILRGALFWEIFLFFSILLLLGVQWSIKLLNDVWPFYISRGSFIFRMILNTLLKLPLFSIWLINLKFTLCYFCRPRFI